MIDSTNTPAVGLISHQGTRGDENDDHANWFTIVRPDRQQIIFVGVVADGVTSTTGGTHASHIAVEAIEATLRDLPDPQETIAEWLATAIQSANDEILFEGKRKPEWQGMSTTVVLAALAGNRLYILHLGDSRAYLHRNGTLYQLTTDHTWAQAAVSAGTLTAAEAANHPGRNQLQRYLGGDKQLNIARAALAPESGYAEEYLLTEPNDRILLCSDGIYHRVERSELEAIANTMVTPQQTVDAMAQAALEQGEIDDITALMFAVPPAETQHDLLYNATNTLDSDEDATVPVNYAS